MQKKIASFCIDHEKLLPGVYVSRIDEVAGHPVTTYDLRMKAPNREPVINMAEVHTIEHIGASFLRFHRVWGKRTIYFGPMGCRTGFYWVINGFHKSRELLPAVIELFEHIADFKGKVPGCSPIECGNYLDHNLPMARLEAARYLETLCRATKKNLEYPK